MVSVRVAVSGIVSLAVVMSGLLCGPVSRTSAQDGDTADGARGTFGVGGDISAGIDERTGSLSLSLPLGGVPGVAADGFVVNATYSHEDAQHGVNRDGLGIGWNLAVPRVDVEAGMVFPASGGAFRIDDSAPTGLAEYPTKDMAFRQLTAAASSHDLRYSMEHPGGKDFFASDGTLVRRVNAFGNGVNFEFDDGQRLVAVTDDGGNRLTIARQENTVELVQPTRVDGVTPKTVLQVTDERLASVTNPVGVRVDFSYRPTGDRGVVLEGASSSEGVLTAVSYQDLAGLNIAVDDVTVIDRATGELVSERQWDVVGEANSSGFPSYEGENALRASGDGAYRYITRLSDGASNVFSEYNAFGLLTSRRVVVDSGDGAFTAQEQRFTFPDNRDGGGLRPDSLPAQYTKPVEVSVVYKNSRGGERVVSERMRWDDWGHVVEQVSADGSHTQTVYDTSAPLVTAGSIRGGLELPVGLVAEQTTTGRDGLVSTTVNTISNDHRSVVATETSTGASGETLTLASRSEFVVTSDGFLAEEHTMAPGREVVGADTTVTRYTKEVDPRSGLLSTSVAHAANTDAQSVSVTRQDVASGLPIEMVDAVGRVSQLSYDAAGREISRVDFAGQRTHTEYNGRTTRVTDPKGVTRVQVTDAAGRVVEKRDNIALVDGVLQPVGGVERVVERTRYEHNGARVVVTDGLGAEWVHTSDVLGRVSEV